MAAVHWPEGCDAGERRHVIRVAGARTNVVEMGAGEPVVLLHGFGDSLGTWRYAIPALARTHHVIAADLPGFGRSHPTTHRPLLDWYAHWTEELIAKVAPRGRAALIGNSLGGAIALDTAIRTPLRVTRLVLVDCAGLGTGVPLWWRLVTAELFRIPPLSGRAARILPERVLERVVGDVYSSLVFHHAARVDPECAKHFAGHYTTAARLRHLFDMGHVVVRELACGRLIGDAEKLHVPTLILWGRQDRLVPVQHGLDLHRRLPDAQLYLFDDCGHCPQLERPAEFASAVERFLRGARAATGARVVGADQLGA